MKSVLDSRQLLAASVLAKTGSFTLAGKELYLTQSAVSHAIRVLEEDLECQLFVRTGRGVVLTPAGVRLLKYAQPILDKMQAARVEMAQAATQGKHVLRIGGSPQTTQFIMPAVLAKFKERFPNYAVWDETAEHDWQIDSLLNRQLDLAFVYRPAERPELTFTPLFEDEMRVIVAANHPWAQLGRVPVSAGDKANIILYSKANQVTDPLREWSEREGVELGPWVELPTVEAIKDMVATGLAAGVLSPWSVQAELADGHFVSLPLGRSALHRQWGVAHLSKRPLSVAEEAIIELCKTALLELTSLLRSKPARSRSDAGKFVPGMMLGAALARSVSGGASIFMSASMAWENFGPAVVAWS